MYNYRIFFSLEGGRIRSKIFSGESEGEAIEHFDFFADSLDQVIEFFDIEEIKNDK